MNKNGELKDDIDMNQEASRCVISLYVVFTRQTSRHRVTAPYQGNCLRNLASLFRERYRLCSTCYLAVGEHPDIGHHIVAEGEVGCLSIPVDSNQRLFP